MSTTPEAVPGPTLDPTATPAPRAHLTRRRQGRFGPAPAILVSSVAAFAVVVVATLFAVEASGVPMLSEATAASLQTISLLLAGRNLLYLLAVAWGGFGVALVARAVLAGRGRGRWLATAALGCCGLSLLAAVGQLVLPLLTAAFAEPRWGDTAGFAAFYAASAVAIWSAVAAAGCVALAVRATGVRPTFMLALALVCLGYLLVDLTTRGAVPPFAVSFVWLTLGLGLRASRVPA